MVKLISIYNRNLAEFKNGNANTVWFLKLMLKSNNSYAASLPAAQYKSNPRQEKDVGTEDEPREGERRKGGFGGP